MKAQINLDFLNTSGYIFGHSQKWSAGNTVAGSWQVFGSYSSNGDIGPDLGHTELLRPFHYNRPNHPKSKSSTGVIVLYSCQFTCLFPIAISYASRLLSSFFLCAVAEARLSCESDNESDNECTDA